MSCRSLREETMPASFKTDQVLGHGGFIKLKGAVNLGKWLFPVSKNINDH